MHCVHALRVRRSSPTLDRMCHFVTAVLPNTVPREVLDGIAKLHGKQFEPLENLSVQEQLRATESYVLATAGVCDCGTGLGALTRSESSVHGRNEDEDRLRRKGWSETKIARSLDMKEGRSLAQHAKREEAALENVQIWLELLAQVFSSNRVPYVGLLLHWYSGPLNSRIQLHGRQVVRREELTAKVLASMREDVVYEFRAV